MIKLVKTGDRVEIGFKGTKEGERRKLTTIAEAVLNDREVLVMMPISSGAMIKLPLGPLFEARFYSGPSIIVYDVTVTGHPIVDGHYLTKLQLESEGKKVQLRDFYRISNAIEFSFSLAKEQLESTELNLYRAVTKDLSGGGMSFVTDLELEEETEIYSNFVLDDEYIVVLGRTMGKQRVMGATYRYQYRCKFLALPDLDQEKIIQYINNQQYKTLGNVKHDKG